MWLVVWLVRGPSPPRASPANVASPYASRRGRLLLSIWVSGGWGFVWTRLIGLRGLFADLYLVVGRGRLVPVLPLYEGSAEVIARARKMGSMGFAMETLPVPGCPGTSGLPRPPLQAEVCKADGQSPRMTMRDR